MMKNIMSIFAVLTIICYRNEFRKMFVLSNKGEKCFLYSKF